RLQKRPANAADGILERIEGLGCVQHTAAGGQLLEPEALAVPEQGGRRGAVHLEDESRSGAHDAGPFGLRGCISNTILVAPRRPAAPAWLTASSKRSRGERADTSRPSWAAATTSMAMSNVRRSAAPDRSQP